MDQPNLSPLHELHLTNSAKFIEFAGWTMPFSYSGTIKEHNYVRNDVGYFDVSHMGFFRLSGVGLLDWLESISTQKISAINPGRCAYTHFLDAKGHIIDDMIFAVTNDEEIAATDCTKWKGCEGEVVLGVPNASMIGTMRKHFEESMFPNMVSWIYSGSGSVTIKSIGVYFSVRGSVTKSVTISKISGK